MTNYSLFFCTYVVYQWFFSKTIRLIPHIRSINHCVFHSRQENIDFTKSLFHLITQVCFIETPPQLFQYDYIF